MAVDVNLSLGEKVVHPQFGEGAVIGILDDGYVRVFFNTGERLVRSDSLRRQLDRASIIVRSVVGSDDRQSEIRLVLEAHTLPLLEKGAALTAAKIDLLPHQVVLTHRTATACPRRFLIADEVGLGKTIETALILRELASRGELTRALMVVPAGLVNNWHRELNEVFNLNFEVFGSEGDVTDRKSNAFLKHDRLIASIDTLKRRARVKRLLDAPPWDLVVFDEAHHLTATRNGGKLTKTENYKLAEALRDHARDMLLLSATPHQGDHFRFWMLIQLLNPSLFNNHDEMLSQRHRLNAIVFRRTKADACRDDGSPLFARRQVHTESFVMSDAERVFYGELRAYLEEGFALAKRQGGKGRALGFVMSVFQKIAASSFAAVKRTLRRRLISLTIQEAIFKDRDLDIEGREQLYDEARALIREEFNLTSDLIGRGEADRILAELKLKVLRKLDENELAILADSHTNESVTAAAEDLVASSVSVSLPEERSIIQALLGRFPEQLETKVEKLLGALGALWKQDPSEKVVVFATYLGTMDLLGREIDARFPGQGVVVLRGGDHGAKVAAERKFKDKKGPRVMVCTAAGREGINLQFSRVLFNFDLPWNPMDIEQRIGRIHRYGQQHTAQVYNLVLSDTIEGRIFLLLNDKLVDIAKAVGKVDEKGNVAEDLRSQILGQLAERLNYDRLYQEALSDPELKRTRLELEAALANAAEAKTAVVDLFQDLDGFNIDDYQQFADLDSDMDVLVSFLTRAEDTRGNQVKRVDDHTYDLVDSVGKRMMRFSTDRENAMARDDVDLLGLDHPRVQEWFEKLRRVPPDRLGCCVSALDYEGGVVAWYLIDTHGSTGDSRNHIECLAITRDGRRQPGLEKLGLDVLLGKPAEPVLSNSERDGLIRDVLEPMLRRELSHTGVISGQAGYSAKLIAWVEVVGE